MEDPIVVNATAAPDQWASAIRYLLMVLAGVAGVLGYAHLAGEFSGLLIIAAPLGGLITLVFGQRKVIAQSDKLKVMANALPDDIATIKKS